MKKLSDSAAGKAPAPAPLPEGSIGERVLYKNNQLIALDKPAGLPVQPDKTGDKSLLQLAEIYCKSKLFLLHRLDRPATGVVLFAKTKTAVGLLNEQFRERLVQKTYLAVVQNAPPEPSRTLQHYLQKIQQTNRAVVAAEGLEEGDFSEMKYRLLGSSERYHMLEVELITGRHHQIRAQLAAIGCPIKGDVKYGARRGNADRSIHLHAWKLAFRHPVSQEEVTLTAEPPKDAVWEAFGEMGCF